MRNLNDISSDLYVMGTMLDLTRAFEGLSSMHIARIKNQVIASQRFFDQLWQIYDQIRVDELFRFGRQRDDSVIDKELLIAITAEGGFSGDIDKQLIDELVKQYDKSKQDVVIIGHHGAIQLARSGIMFRRYFKMPESNDNINVKPLIDIVRRYRTTTVFYQNYVSLMQQKVKRIELHEAVTSEGRELSGDREVIDESTYIFEPSNFAVIAHLERSMMEITLGQVIFDSKLAQNASRFRAMSSARDRSKEAHDDLLLEFNHSKRELSDQRLKEIISGMKVATV